MTVTTNTGSGPVRRGPITVEGELVLRDTVEGDVTVPRGTYLEVRGRVTGTIKVASGGRAVLYGECIGKLKNDGQVDVYGVVTDGITGKGQTRVSNQALVSGVRGSKLDYERTPQENHEAGDGDVTVNVTPSGEVVVVGDRLIEEPVVVDGQMDIRGAAVAGVRVLRDSWFILDGSILGGLVVEKGGHAVIKGFCNGGLVNEGEVDVFGVLYGGISGDGITRVAPDAVIDSAFGRDLDWDAAGPGI